jgi:hypothetical protein
MHDETAVEGGLARDEQKGSARFILIHGMVFAAAGIVAAILVTIWG